VDDRGTPVFGEEPGSESPGEHGDPGIRAGHCSSRHGTRHQYVSLGTSMLTWCFSYLHVWFDVKMCFLYGCTLVREYASYCYN